MFLFIVVAKSAVGVEVAVENVAGLLWFLFLFLLISDMMDIQLLRKLPG